ncbi:MAG: hypothetical protein IT162_10220 [Bryobacterales bacterium]|nr:hypothetical protein [Bryobacterales bacterium]
MRNFLLLALGVFAGVSLASAQPAMWIWSDKNVYLAGESLTLRGTLKPNGDAGEYTIVAFRQNNQDGRRYFLPAGTEEPTDIYGNTMAQGFRASTLPELNKSVLAGPDGVVVKSTVTVPEQFGMHTLVLQLRDATGTRVLKSAYWKIGVVREFVDLPNEITADRTLNNDRAYRISGIVQVKSSNLVIEPGTFVIGQPGSQPPSVLLITNTARLYAEGTRSRPVIMTSSRPVGERQRGDWGGLIMLGKAPINDPGGNLPIEGLPDTPETRFGGTDAAHNCGSLRYVRVEYAGAQLRPNEETNAFTWGGCGTSTQASYLQAHYGFDDAFEWFGGNNDAKYLVGTYAADDFVDVQIGYTGRVQYVLALANQDNSNRCIEADNYERDFAAKPLGKWQIWNLTCVGNGLTRGFDETDASAVYLRRGAAGTYNNILAYNWQTRGMSLANDDSVLANGANGDLQMNGLLFWNNGGLANDTTNQVIAGFRPFFTGTAKNTQFADPKLARPIEYSDPDFRALAGSTVGAANWVAPPDDLFFDQSARFIGAFGDVNWAEEWATFAQEEDLKP